MRDAFALAKEKAPAIIFIDEIDAVGTKRFDSELSGTSARAPRLRAATAAAEPLACRAPRRRPRGAAHDA